MSKKKVLLLFGGESSEHEVSLSSAKNVHDAIDRDEYEVSLCYIDKYGKWWLVADVGDDNGEQLFPMLGYGEFTTQPSGVSIKPDVIFPILHGRNGEDGTVQGLAQLLHIPIVGCDVTASGIAMNKLACKSILHDNGVNIIPYRSHFDYQSMPEFGDLSQELGDVLFVKPARAGSSVGVSKVKNQRELKEALDEAHRHDPIALIEKAITGKELEVAVLGTPPNHKVSGVGEIIPGEDFYTYDDKYAQTSKAQVNIAASIDDEQKERIRDIAGRIFEILDCNGLSRIDFILSSDDELYLMEVNTMPGFTNISMYPKLWQEQGISYSKLIDELIKDAFVSGTIDIEN